ncbi:MAG: hypothetical protein LBH54_03125, partial [Clostridiales bacterium]|nr:hypothetical protein [Clostridiales bacterium]
MNRIKLCGIASVTVFALLLARLGYISLYRGERYAREAAVQRTEHIPIKTARGVIYDRNMLAITEGQSRLYAAVVPKECADLDEAARLIGQDFTGEDLQIFALGAVTERQARLVKMRGVSLFNVSERYNAGGVLSHVIGYTSDNGGFGIERVFNDALTAEANDSISMIKNANRKLMSGLGYRKQSVKTYQGVKLSVDYHIQKIAEAAMDRGVERGAAVVVDVRTGDIAAMVSRPNFKQSEIAKYLDSGKGELLNRAIMPYDVGSVFKTVLTAAALEEGEFLPRSAFMCYGGLD